MCLHIFRLAHFVWRKCWKSASYASNANYIQFKWKTHSMGAGERKNEVVSWIIGYIYINVIDFNWLGNFQHVPNWIECETLVIFIRIVVKHSTDWTKRNKQLNPSLIRNWSIKPHRLCSFPSSIIAHNANALFPRNISHSSLTTCSQSLFNWFLVTFRCSHSVSMFKYLFHSQRATISSSNWKREIT